MGMYPAEQQAREAYDSLAKTIGPADECAILKAENDRLRQANADLKDERSRLLGELRKIRDAAHIVLMQ